MRFTRSPRVKCDASAKRAMRTGTGSGVGDFQGHARAGRGVPRPAQLKNPLPTSAVSLLAC